MKMASFPHGRRLAPRLQIFVSDLSATGVVRNAIAIANEAAASGYAVRLLTCSPDGVMKNQVRAGVTVVRLIENGSAARSRGRQLQQSLLAYRRHCEAWHPDIMLSAGNHGHLVSGIAWLGLPGTKVLRVSNDLRHRSPSLFTCLWRDLKFRAVSWLADRLVLVSNAHGEHPLLADHLATGKAQVIANGVDVEAVRAAATHPCPHPWTRDPAVPFLLAVGRHSPQKNFSTLVSAFARVREHKRLRLIILGDGPKQETERLQALANSLGIREDVDFVAATADPFPYMAAARALALPSLWEGSSNVLLEAMACGTPILASRAAGDAPHVLAEGQFGMLFDPNDVEGLAHSILHQTGSDPVKPGERASQFDRHTAMRHYIRLFDDLLDEAAASRSARTPVRRLTASRSAQYHRV